MREKDKKDNEGRKPKNGKKMLENQLRRTKKA